MVGANMRAHCAQNLGTEYANSLPLLGDVMADILTLFGCNTVFGVGGDFADNIISAFEGKLESWDYEPRNATDDIVAMILDAYHEHQIK